MIGLLVTKLRRDLLRYGSQFVSVLLMSALSVTVYAGLEGAWRGMQVEIDRFAAESALPDAWVRASASTASDVAALTRLPGVVDVSSSTTFPLLHARADGTGTLLVTSSGSTSVNRPLVTAGAPVDPDGEGIWIDAAYAQAHGVVVGDRIQLSRPGHADAPVVRGLVVVPDALALTAPGLIAPDFDDYAPALMSAAEAADAFGIAFTGDTLRVVGGAAEVQEHAPDILGERYLGFSDRTSNPSIAPVFIRVGQIRDVSVMFSSLFVLVALLAMSTSIRRLVEIQRTETATLGALGLGRTTIGLSFVGLSSTVVVIGAAVGAALAPALSSYVLGTQQEAFALPNWRISYSWTTPLLALGLLLACAVAAWAVTAGARSRSPAVGMRPAAERSHRLLIERSPRAWSRIGFGERWALRDAVGNPLRIGVGVLASSGCMMLLLAGFGIPESLSHQVARGYDDQYRYADWVAVAPGATPEQLAALETAAGSGQWVMQRPFRFDGKDRTEYVLTVLGPGDLFVLRDADDRVLDLGAGAAITPRVRATADAVIGSPVRIEVGGGQTVDVSLASTAVISQPQGILLTRAEWTESGGVFAPTAYLTRSPLPPGALDDSAAATTTLPLGQQRANAEQVIASLGGVFTIMKVLAVLLAVVSLYNLGALSFSERQRSYATLRVLGSRTRELRRLAGTENALTAVVGWLLGIPLGLWFLAQYTALFSDDRAVYVPHVTAPTLVTASAVTLFFALTATLLLTRRVRRIEMASALKGVE
ncbi:hypothetical protein C1I63_00920 [Rathayibacter caricis DSM 15933]|uniref:ABC3 transporter permease C-terminal domain-containing protein n=1 Tax=Rathayibacter caricis DSM 15933 TaxID=1328867 RepID=A0A2T4UPU5_9MICO|nr:ABC transporter permease [Rathayibacter caricis]PTL71553.1 hypothetical protein C1I63_00920 [Rathayibacter caricis DSM 15933]